MYVHMCTCSRLKNIHKLEHYLDSKEESNVSNKVFTVTALLTCTSLTQLVRTIVMFSCTSVRVVLILFFSFLNWTTSLYNSFILLSCLSLLYSLISVRRYNYHSHIITNKYNSHQSTESHIKYMYVHIVTCAFFSLQCGNK